MADSLVSVNQTTNRSGHIIIVMVSVRETFATQVNSEMLLAVRALAEKDGRQLQAPGHEALADLLLAEFYPQLARDPTWSDAGPPRSPLPPQRSPDSATHEGVAQSRYPLLLGALQPLTDRLRETLHRSRPVPRSTPLFIILH